MHMQTVVEKIHCGSQQLIEPQEVFLERAIFVSGRRQTAGGNGIQRSNNMEVLGLVFCRADETRPPHAGTTAVARIREA